MRVGLIQHDIVWEDAVATRAHVTPMIASAAAGGARLVVLSEMFATGFSMEPERVAEDEGGPTETFLLEQARAHGITLIASIAQRGHDGLHRNNAVIAQASGEVQRYAKIHPFGFAGEDAVYTAGSEFCTVTIDGLRVTVFVCYDLRFADEFWATGPGSDVFVVPANWPAGRQAHWDALLIARAIENQAYVVGVNRVGDAPDALTHAGGSVVIDPLGESLVRAGDTETVLVAEIDPARVAQIRAKFPFLADRR